MQLIRSVLCNVYVELFYEADIKFNNVNYCIIKKEIFIYEI